MTMVTFDLQMRCLQAFEVFALQSVLDEELTSSCTRGPGWPVIEPTQEASAPL